MKGAELSELAIFLVVARHKSFRRAALERQIAPSAVSHAIRRLEERVGVRLFHRTTRSVSLTEAGARFLAELEPAFAQMGQAIEGLNSYRDTPFGTVRLTISSSIAPFVLHGVMGPLIRDNPGLQLDIVATDLLVDIAEEGYDAGIRFGEKLSQDMIAVQIRSGLRTAVVATPAYFASQPPPLTPAELCHHACIRYRFPSGAIYNWRFSRGAEAVQVEVNGPITLDNQDLMIEAALQDCGLAYVWESRVQHLLDNGSLIRCLDEWCAPDDGLFLYYPSRRHASAGLRALIAQLKADK